MTKEFDPILFFCGIVLTLIALYLSLSFFYNLPEVGTQQGKCFDRYGNEMMGQNCIEDRSQLEIVSLVIPIVIFLVIFLFAGIWFIIDSFGRKDET